MSVSDGIEDQPKKGGKLTGWHVLFYLMCFFGVMFVANGFFVYYAATTWPGTVTDSSYRASQTFNDRLAEGREQIERGWTIDLALLGDPATAPALVLEARGADGEPLHNMDFSFSIGRVVTSAADASFSMEEMDYGRYRAILPPMAPGEWRIVLEGRGASDEVLFRSQERLYIRQR